VPSTGEVMPGPIGRAPGLRVRVTARAKTAVLGCCPYKRALQNRLSIKRVGDEAPSRGPNRGPIASGTPGGPVPPRRGRRAPPSPRWCTAGRARTRHQSLQATLCKGVSTLYGEKWSGLQRNDSATHG
jgi:hypothetical protein